MILFEKRYLIVYRARTDGFDVTGKLYTSIGNQKLYQVIPEWKQMIKEELVWKQMIKEELVLENNNLDIKTITIVILNIIRIN